MRVPLESSMMYGGRVYTPDSSGFAEVPDGVAIALGYSAADATAVVSSEASEEKPVTDENPTTTRRRKVDASTESE
jgi:hypothetical protein